MLESVMNNAVSFAARMIQKDPGSIMGPIDSFLGYILNFIFNGVFYLTQPNSLGLTIIVFTLLVRALMAPSSVKQYKSTLISKKLQPEIEKIKAKYGGSKDPEQQRKMNAETQALYSQHGYNPLSGCVPLLVTMPIFFALSYLLRQPYMFIERIGTIYEQLAVTIMQVDGYSSIIKPLSEKMVPKDMNIEFHLVTDMLKVLNGFNSNDWAKVLSEVTAVSPEIGAKLSDILAQKVNMETFFTLNLLDTPRMAFPDLLIPILTAGTQFLSSFYMNKTNGQTEQNQKTMQMTMLVIMPIFMAWLTFTTQMGLGIYWVCINVVMFVQQWVLTVYFRRKDKRSEIVVSA